MKEHPNATAAVLAAYVASIVAYAAGQAGLDLPNEVAVSAGGLVIAGVLAFGKKRNAE